MIYLDSDYKAHAAQNETETLTPWADPDGYFAGKCDAFIAGYRVVPDGETWMRADGTAFTGLMIAPAENYAVLLAAQAEADQQTIDDLDAAVVDLTYNNILLEMGVE